MEPPAKKQKDGEIQRNLQLEGFQFERILTNDTKAKRICVLGKFQDSEDDAVVVMSKSAFSEESIKNILSSDTTLNEGFMNDIYSQHNAHTKPENNIIATNVIKPATEKHIQKYSQQNMFLMNETSEDYTNITLPFIEKQQFSIEWVYNILDHKKESDRILYEDSDKENGFIILPDLKWNGKDVEELYLTAICHSRKLRSIRDLNASHLQMLKNILDKGMEIIASKYNVPHTQIRAYFHYYPTYYHLHVHFNHLQNDVGGISIGKAHLLSDVIDNIERVDGNYYKKKTLPVLVRERDPLYKLLLKQPEV